MSISNSLLEEIKNYAYRFNIGNTPLYKIGNIYSKLEYYNKFGSVKARAAFFMVEYAIKTGELDKNKIIIEASSGNTGIAIAGIANLLGYKSEIVIPEGASEETKRILLKYNANLILTPGDSTENSIKYVEDKIKNEPEKYYQLNQHNNDLNSDAHYYTTGPEIDHEIENIGYIVAGIGTGGTITGLARYFKEKYNVKVIGVIPDEDSHIFGLRNPFKSKNKGLIDNYKNYIDEILTVNENEAYNGVKDIKEKYNLFCRPFIGC